MNIVLKGIDRVFECSAGHVCSVIIENQDMFLDIISDIDSQIQGNEGISVISENNQIVKTDKYLEQITQFVPFDLNKKTLINKIVANMQNIASDESHLTQTNEVLAAWEKLCMDIEFELNANIDFYKISAETLIKSAGVTIADDYDSLSEKILDYFQMIEEFECKKMFVLVNMRSFVNDDEMQRFVDTVIMRNHQIILLDNVEHKLLNGEKRYIIDEDLCEICYN